MRKTTLLLIFAALAACGLFIPGCDDLVTETTEETVAGVPTADFASDKDSGCAPLTVEFTTQSDGPINKWSWYFGDGDSSNDTNPIHIYDSIGTYTCSLRVEDTLSGEKDSETKKRFIKVGQTIDSFHMDSTSGCPGLRVHFTPFGYAGVATWQWNYGDGSPLEKDSVTTSHIYSQPGQYVVKLTVDGECGKTDLTDTVTITDCPTVSFVANIAEGCVPLTISFGDSSHVSDSQVVLSRLWDFGGGTPPTSTEQNPIVVFDSDTTYTVSLTVTSTGGTTTLERPDFITAYDGTTAAFTTTSDKTGCFDAGSQFLVWFENESKGNIDSVRWKFGDGTTDTARNPVHAYTDTGGYDVSLETYGKCGPDLVADTLTVSDYVILFDSLTTAAFSYTVDSLKYTFVDESPGSVFVRHWDFGTSDPADTSRLTSPVFDFSSPGTYTVTLTVSNDCNAVAAESTLVVVE